MIFSITKKTGQIIKKYRLISNYLAKQYKVHKSNCNEDTIKNVVNREFNRKDILEVVSYLSYINVGGK